MPTRQLTDFLDAQHVSYHSIHHEPVFTAQELAAAMHIPGREVAKTVVVKLDDRTAMAVVPAESRVDLRRVKQVAGAQAAALLTESEFASRFSGCEVGAMPPFGNLFGMDTYVDDRIAADSEIVFNAGTHSEAIRLAYDDYERCVHPRVARLRLED